MDSIIDFFKDCTTAKEALQRYSTFEIIMDKLVLPMLDYQKKNNITKKCVINSLYLHNSLQASGLNVKVVAVYIFSKKARILGAGHLIVKSEDFGYIESSYDIFQLGDVVYYETVQEMMKDTEIESQAYDKVRLSIKYHLDFIKRANLINNGGGLDKKKDKDNYYHKLADYIEQNKND